MKPKPDLTFLDEATTITPEIYGELRQRVDKVTAEYNHLNKRVDHSVQIDVDLVKTWLDVPIPERKPYNHSPEIRRAAVVCSTNGERSPNPHEKIFPLRSDRKHGYAGAVCVLCNEGCNDSTHKLKGERICNACFDKKNQK